VQAVNKRMKDMIMTKKFGIAGLFVVLLTKKKTPIVKRKRIVDGIRPDIR
jgi:hypothetical protein